MTVAYTPKNFNVPVDGSKPTEPQSQAALDALESISASDKAQAVPYALLWEIDPMTGDAMHSIEGDKSRSRRPLSIVMIEPPSFGASVDTKFRERPPASIESIVVKEAPSSYGTIMFRQIEIAMTVHRPDVVFDDHIFLKNGKNTHRSDEADSFSSLLTPGEAFALEYGWSSSTGVRNEMLNGLGFETGDNYTDPSGAVSRIVIPGRKQIRFSIINYTFSILADNQISFKIFGMELGETNIRQAFLTNRPDQKSQEVSGKTVKVKTTFRDKIETFDVDPYANDSTALIEILNKFQDRLSDDKESLVFDRNKAVTSVPFGKVFDDIFADIIKNSYERDMNVRVRGIYIGKFNKRVGTPTQKYSPGGDLSGKPISDVLFPLDDIEKIFRDKIKAGTRMTVYNFMQPFFEVIGRQQTWVNGAKESIPEIGMKTIFSTAADGRQEVTIHIFDKKYEFVRFSKDDDSKIPREASSRSELRQMLRDAGVQYVSFMRANSFIEDSQFEVMIDDQMKSLFMRRNRGPDITRDEKTSQPDIARSENAIPPAQQIFMNAMQGRIKMLGNFAFDTFGYVWLDFGVYLWDGPFNVFEVTHTISPGDFTTDISLYSAGNKPLVLKEK